MRRLGVALTVAVLIPAQGFLAQGNVPHTSRIVGIVIDSLHKSGLEGAEVLVSGRSSPVITDSLGRFSIDSLPPGTYQVGVFHPLLESLGLTLATKPFTVGRDSTGVANLAIPSVESLARRYCGEEVTSAQPAVVAGRVLDPETEQPVSGATVSMAWTDLVVSKKVGVVGTPHVLSTITDSVGFFKFCGLRQDVDATVKAERSGNSTGEVSISTEGSALTFENLTLAGAPIATAPRGVVRGGVFSLDDKPVTGARVEAAISGTAVVTKEDGSFSLDGVPSGTQTLVVRHIGFEPTRLSVNVTSRQPIEVRVTLGPAVNIMDPVLVTARRNYALDKDGFTARRRSGWGSYFTASDIDRRNPQYLTDMLTMIPGIRVEHGPGGAIVLDDRVTSILNRGRLGGACPSVWVDGNQWRSYQPGDIDLFVSPREIAGLEVYKGGQAPAQFRGVEDCVTIVVWTMPPGEVTRR